MEIPFYKMQGCGNDFIIFDNRRYSFTMAQLSTLAKQICQQRVSLGGDALMVVDNPRATGDFRMIFFNADGSEAEMCGNGARCLARYAYEEGIAGPVMTIETLAGLVPAWREDQRTYRVRLNEPTKYAANLDFSKEELVEELLAGKTSEASSQSTPEEKLAIIQRAQDISFLDYVELGNPGLPHLVVGYPQLAETALADLKPLAQALRNWSALPKGANVNFVAVAPVPDSEILAANLAKEVSQDLVKPAGQVIVRTYERGVEDFTLACGTGAGSVAYSLVQRKLVQTGAPVVLDVLGGQLAVAVRGKQLDLIGPTNVVAKGLLVDEDVQF
ncbi:diaminopimelate epimerase [Enterococcus asini]|uniref:diaminopimelate epimerase n=1 Tax=Enterococcus asini TaxID=57732 RepID=UPI002890C04A|nr:diaminopimelate epimerase [Enterococcus asini]MDT2744539.1 diaminopimelate epimerase [Enterococcus asini]